MAQSGHPGNGDDLTRERTLTEQVDRELKLIDLAEKKGRLVNLEQLRSALTAMVAAFRRELFEADAKLKSEIDRLHGVDVDVQLINHYTNQALSQLAPYDSIKVMANPALTSLEAPAGEADETGVKLVER
jgi:hypothetical protein